MTTLGSGKVVDELCSSAGMYFSGRFGAKEEKEIGEGERSKKANGQQGANSSKRRAAVIETWQQ